MAPNSPGGLIRWVLPTAFVLALVVVALLVAPYLSGDGSEGRLVLVEISGDVGVSTADGHVEAAAPGRVVRAAEQLQTGASSSAILSAGPDTEIRLSPDTRMTVESIRDDVVTVELDEGRVRADVRGGRRGVRVGSSGRSVQTRDGSVAVAVNEGILAVEVERGTVTAEGIDGVERIGAGGRAVVFSDGEAALGTIPDEVLLSVAWPEARRTRQRQVPISGTTQPGAVVIVRSGSKDVRLEANAQGVFSATLTLEEGSQPVVVQATDPFGRTVSAEAHIELDTTPPRIGGGAGVPLDSVQRTP
ncbi:MAG: FecR domain-containing protein [Myxococcota bacterium]